VKQLAELVIEQQALDGRHDDFRLPPVVTVLFVDDRMEIVLEELDEAFLGLVLQFQRSTRNRTRLALPVRRKSLMTPARSTSCLSGGHFEEETSHCPFHGILDRRDGSDLVRPEEFQLGVLDKGISLAGVCQRGSLA